MVAVATLVMEREVNATTIFLHEKRIDKHTRYGTARPTKINSILAERKSRILVFASDHELNAEEWIQTVKLTQRTLPGQGMRDFNTNLQILALDMKESR